MMVAWSRETYKDKPEPYKSILGMGCMNPGAFINSLHCVLKAQSFEEGVRANLLAGGDNCGRAMFVGSVLGAAFGVPPALAAKMEGLEAKNKVIAAALG